MQRGSLSLGQSQPLVTVDGLNISLCCMFLSVSATKLLTVINDGACGMWAASSAQPNAAHLRLKWQLAKPRRRQYQLANWKPLKKQLQIEDFKYRRNASCSYQLYGMYGEITLAVNSAKSLAGQEFSLS